MSAEVARAWMDAVERSARERDYEAHMDLVSRRVQVFGTPGFDVIDYDNWARQSRHEFDAGILAAVSYLGLKVIVSQPERVMFRTVERVEATDGTVHEHGLEALLEREPDGQWRVVQEKVLSDEETAFSGLRLARAAGH
jgi:ketosteroid isomerase-like protein